MNWLLNVVVIFSLGFAVDHCTAQSSTAAPAPDVTPGPQVGLYFNGTVVANSTISYDCSNKYTDAFRTSFESVCKTVTEYIGADIMCVKSPQIIVVAADISFTASGTSARLAFSSFVIPPDTIAIRECEECSWECAIYIDDLNNWPNPIIPPIPGCPNVAFEPYRFDNGKSNWRCV